MRRSAAQIVFKSRWELTRKLLPAENGCTKEAAKAAMVARGFQQIEEDDYSETFDSVFQ